MVLRFTGVHIILVLPSCTYCDDSLNSSTSISTTNSAFFSANESSKVTIPNTVIQFRKRIAFSFRTCTSGQLLFQEGRSNNFSIAISSVGSLDLTIYENSVKHFISISTGLNNNIWYTVDINFLNGNIYLKIERGNSLVSETLISNSTYNYFLWNLDLSGGSGLHVGIQFTGCVQAGPSVALNDPARQATNVEWNTCPIASNPNYPGCKAPIPDPCWQYPCRNGGSCNSTDTQYTCTCPKTYTGKNCEVDVGKEACKYEPCENGGTCEQLTEGGTRTYRCLCSAGYTGIHCEINIYECISNPCQNGGKCVDLVAGYVCECATTGYTGQQCTENINECSSNPCANGATCSDTPGSYKCDCPLGFGGANCSLSVDECSSMPCQNGGSCQDDVGSYNCQCASGFTGINCETNIDDCVSVTCSVPNTVCVDGVNDYTCRCKPGYYDPSDAAGNSGECLDVNECAGNPCMNNATCLNKENHYTCNCLPGFTGTNCEVNIQECESNPCVNALMCTDGINAYFCKCLPGYTDTVCGTNIDDCIGNPCKNGQCVDGVDGYNCTCEPGWTGINCEVQINECQSGPCQNEGICIDQQASYECDCKPGFTGLHCETNIDDCVNSPCQHGGTCVDEVSAYRCDCTPDFMGQDCLMGYDACHSSFEPCKNGATCITSPPQHNYTCICAEGFNGSDCENNIDDCVPGACPSFKECVDAVNSFSCQCPLGFTGLDCSEDIDECASSPCQHGATCQNLVGKYGCTCVTSNISLVEYSKDPRSVYQTGYKGVNCELNIDECLYQPPICQNNGVCRDNTGDFECLCPGNNFASGPYCEVKIPFCTIVEQRFNQLNDSPVCHNGGVCVSTVQSYQCNCKPGFTGPRCKINIDECSSNPCMYGGTCTDQINGYICSCLEGLTGSNCETNIDECHSQPCINGGNCMDKINGYVCNCSDTGYKGTHCEIDINECESNPCVNNATCDNNVKDYNCNCYPGYTGKNCEVDIDECASSPCQNAGNCVQRSDETKPGFLYIDAEGYDCSCVPGYSGVHCETDIDECASNPCVHGTCMDKVNMYQCQCEAGYHGVNCETEINECTTYSPCQNGATCVDKLADYTCTCAKANSEGKIYGGKNCSIELTGCQGNICWNKAQCEPYLTPGLGHDYKCVCQFGSHGRYCEDLTTATFKRGSWLQFENSTGTTDLEMKLRFRTTLPNGVIAFNLANLNSKYLMLSLRNKNVLQLVYHNQLVSYTLEISTNSSMDLNNGQWQTVEFSVSSSGILFNLTHSDCFGEGNKCSNNTFFENASVLHTLSTTTLSFKQTDISQDVLNNVLMNMPGFVGCMEDVVINSDWIIPVEYMNTQQANIEFKCDRKDPCVPDPCSGHGLCNDLWYEASCTCNRPYLGAACDQIFNPATFGYNGEQSMASIAIPAAEQEQMKTKAEISLFIRTRQRNALIFYLGDASGQSYIAAEIKGGFIEANANFNGDTKTVLVSTAQVDDGNPHFIHLTYDNPSKTLSLVVDSVEKSETFSPTNILTATNLYIGSLPGASTSGRKKRQVSNTPTITYNAPSYKGTIQDMRVGGKTLQFFPVTDQNVPPSLGTPTMQNVRPGEVTDDVCMLIQPCRNNSTCNNTFFNDYTCTCKDGYTGKNCTELDFCMHTKCPTSTTCKDLNDGYECISPATFSGIQNYVRYVPSLGNLSSISTISMKLRTRDNSGVLLHIYGKNPSSTSGVRQYMTIELVGSSNLSIAIDVGVKKVVKINQFLISDGKWHDLSIDFGQSQLKVTMDTVSAVYAVSLSGGSLSDIVNDESTIYLGGLPLSYNTRYIESQTVTQFKGCIDEPRIAGILLPFFRPDQFINQTTATKFDVIFLTNVEIGCQSDPVCDTNQCKNEATCVDIWNAYDCKCVFGFDGTRCEYNIDDCNNNNCLNNARCVDGIAQFTCHCHPGYTGVRCETDIDECEGITCENNGTCIDGNNTFTCNCTEGFVGTTCQIELGETCQNDSCQNNATCINATIEYPDYGTVVTFNCSCLPGFTGYNCETEINYCEGDPCQNGATCMSITEQEVYQCTCVNGYTGKDCETNIDECADSPCKNDATCTDLVGDYQCTCAPGWTGKSCDNDINECSDAEANGTMLCDNGGVCVNIDGSYQCNCTGTGYRGVRCEIEIDECNETMPCRSGGECTNTPGSFECNCTLGYSGTTCEMANCTDLCENGGTCKIEDKEDDQGPYTEWECLCPKYFEGSQCETRGPCVDGPCENNAICSQNDTDYSCECEPGWTNKNCSQDIDECQGGDICKNGGTCNNYPGSYNCTCAPGYYGDHCDNEINECDSNPCMNNGTCTDKVNGFECNCTGTGYEGPRCGVDINECNIGNPCKNGATCENKMPFYICNCVPGYVGDTCHSYNPCNDTDYCANEGECDIEVNDVFKNATATCECVDGWLPPKCMESLVGPTKKPTTESSDLNLIPIIVGVCVGVTVLIILIVVIVMLMRVKEKRATRGTYSPSRQEMSGSRMDMGNNLKVPPPERLI